MAPIDTPVQELFQLVLAHAEDICEDFDPPPDVPLFEYVETIYEDHDSKNCKKCDEIHKQEEYVNSLRDENNRKIIVKRNDNFDDNLRGEK